MEFTDQNFEKEVLRSRLLVMVDFWASWCPPCKMMEPIVDQLKVEFAGRVKIGKMNVDRNQKTSGKYSISGVPTFILFRDGKEVGRKVAAAQIGDMKRFIESVMKL